MKAFLRFFAAFAILLQGFVALAQPANDNCSGATNIGTLPTPGACTSGLQNGAPITLNNQTTVSATSPNPYIYQTACQGGGDMTTFALDTWYVFTATGTTVNVVITGFPGVQMALYSGTCGNLSGMGCSTNGTMNVTQIFVGQTYYLQVSGNTTSATDNNFSISIDNDIDCNDCLRVSSLTATPAPVNGGYAPGQVVHFCYTVTDYQEINTNWFHGVQISMGPGWTGVVSNPVPSPECNVDVTPGPGDAGAGTWAWYPAGVTSSANGTVWPAGFYFDNANVAGTNAGANFGDPGNCGWTFCWDLTVSNTCMNGASLNVTVNTSGDGESGSWSSLGCVDDPATVFSAIQLCCSATATNTGPYCNGGTVQLNGTGGGTYSWTGPNGFTSTLQNPTLPATAAAAGVYTLTIDNLGCIATSSTTVTVNPIPTVSVNSPTVCAGASATVTATPGAAGTYNYAWTVPTGATNPGNVASFTTTTAGSYSVVITNSTTNCVSGSASGTVTINPNPTVSVNSPSICAGVAATVTATPGTAGSYNYAWTVPGGVTNPGNVASFSTLTAGTYSVIITDPATGCFSASGSGTVGVNPTPTVSVNSPTVCSGANATVTATPGAAGSYNYVWTVPGGVTNPGNVASFTTTTAGSYSVVITNTSTGCTSTSASGTVTLNPLPTVTVTNPTVCSGTNATITATPGSAGTYDYTWTVPAGVTNPGNVATFTSTTAGTYSVVITNTSTGCNSTSATGTVTVDPLPTVTVNSPTVCAGSNATVTATPGSAGTYSYAWTVPAGVTNPGDVASFTATTAGTYSVIITNTSTTCVSASSAGSVIVNPIPAAPLAGTDSTYCASWTLVPMTASGTGGTYTWYSDAALTANLGTGSTYTPGNVVGATSYYVTETVAGCQGPASVVVITINNCDITVPTAFTPDGDAVNDVWEIVDLDATYPNNVVTVYNRWGNKLYESKKGDYASKPWDGTFEGKDMPVGSYYFVIDTGNEDFEPIRGIVSIVLNK